MTPEQTRQKIKADPQWFIENILGDRLWDKQLEAIESLRDNNRVCVRSCHSIGKSFLAARAVLWFMFAHKPAVVLTTAPTFRQVEGILWREIRTAIANAKQKLGGRITTVKYELENNWFALGLSTDEPDRFQGYHSPNILVIPDESSGIPPTIFEAVEGVLASGNAKMMLIGNPTDPSGYFAQSFKSPLYRKIAISALDTPNFKSFATWDDLRNSTQEQRDKAVVLPYLVSPQWAYERLLEWGEDTPMFAARVKGEFPAQADNALISLAWVEQAARQWSDLIEPSGEEQFGVDVARFGDDKTVFYRRKGNRAWIHAKYGKLDTMETTGKIVALARENPEAAFAIDSVGVGAGVVDRCNELGLSNVYGVNVGEGSTEPDKVNKRAEYFWSLRDRFAQGDIILKDDDETTQQLTALTYKYTSTGKIQIESKEDMKKRGMKSPDLADALMLCFAPVQHSVNSFSFGTV